ncbi:MAG: hypothetical protein R2912_02420 [Eubacteriales bacterium]
MTERELFKEAVMQYMVDDARIVRVSKARSTRPIVRKILFAVACILVVVSVSVFSIPSARAAVEEWISGWFSAQDYFGQEKENRTKEPTIEAIITSAGGNTAQVVESGIGFESYAEAFELTLDEIAYDGETIFISGTMSGATARPFLQLHTGGDTFRATKNDGSLGGDPAQEYYFFGYESLFELTTEDGGKYIGFINPHITEDMNPILNAAAAAETEPIFQNSMLITTNAVADKLWDSYLADHNILFSGELIKVYENMQPMTGIVRGNLSLRLFYGNVEGVESTPVLTATFDKITIDATAYQQQAQTALTDSVASVNLAGIHPVTIEEWQADAEHISGNSEVYYYTRELDFSGASISIKSMVFTPTDTQITLHITLPEAWSREERKGSRIEYHFLLDDKRVQDASLSLFNASGPVVSDYDTNDFLEYDYKLFESMLSPSQWADAKTLTIIPMTVYWWDMNIRYDEGAFQSFSLRDNAVFTAIANHTVFEFNEQYDEMTQYALAINLDDYR